MSGGMGSIRITSVPPGEAPAAIREAWIGLELPRVRKSPGRYLGSGVLSGPRGWIATVTHLVTLRLELQRGFAVPSLRAIEVLERSRPDAARWWKENAPHTARERHYFIFSTDCCEPVEQGES